MSDENYVAAELIGRSERNLPQRVTNLEGIALYGSQNLAAFPDPEERANKIFGYNATGVPTIYPKEDFKGDTGPAPTTQQIEIAVDAKLPTVIPPAVAAYLAANPQVMIAGLRKTTAAGHATANPPWEDDEPWCDVTVTPPIFGIGPDYEAGKYLRPADQGDIAMVFEGDSITAGGSGGFGNYPDLLVALPYFAGRTTFNNVATSGNGLAQIVSQYATEVYPLRPSENGGKRTILHVLIGANDGSATPSAWANTLKTYVDTAKSDGFEVWICTIMKRTGAGNFGAMNEALRNTVVADKLIELENIFSDPNNTQVLHDGLHPTNTGYRLIADEIHTHAVSQNARGSQNGLRWGENWLTGLQNIVTTEAYSGLVFAHRCAGSPSNFLHYAQFKDNGVAFDVSYVETMQFGGALSSNLLVRRPITPGSGLIATGLNVAAPNEVLHVGGHIKGESFTPTLGPFADDAAAATGGIKIGSLYNKTGGTVAWRQS